MAEMPACVICGKTLTFVNGLYCSPKCYRIYLERAAQTASEPVVVHKPVPDSKRPATNEPAVGKPLLPPEPFKINLVPTVIAGGAARQCRASSERIHAILADIALGLNEKEALAVNGVNPRTWIRWKKMSKAFPTLAAHAAGIRKKVLLQRKARLVENKLDWKEAAWDLERRFPEFADPAKLGNTYIGAQQINYAPSEEKAREIEARRQASLARLAAQGIIGNGDKDGADRRDVPGEDRTVPTVERLR